MQELHSPGLRARVFYSPLEAAIAWAGLMAVEGQILAVARGTNRLPADADVSQWPQLRLCTDRIFDALVHFELPFGKAGMTSNDPGLLDDPGLTIRHVDLKVWMNHFYPDQRPSFLFDAFERHLHPAISVDAVQALLMDREALKVQLSDRIQAWDALYEQFQTLSQEHQARRAQEKQAGIPGPRSETTYLNIVGGLLTLLLGKSPSGVPYSSFETLEAVVTALVAHYGEKPGISERTLWAKLSAAKRHLAS
ncbi:hypothetical protein [Acidovorax sp. MR-S7]|uniref:hypothetical protein n=1 Tax=Acidovorax sp. MR-S7 TaxID=1268622 RepID=UPI0003823141|nr:hypothetical protein [Acidovorax sp. MR-S7]GAD24680.1 hypothetical protein AVS7_04440 [Acidovorax sp. MR-S7]